MKLTAIFEQWHLPDGNYPPFSVEDEVCLAFQVEVEGESLNLTEASDPHVTSFEHQGFGEYSFYAKLIRIYQNPTETPLAIFEASGFRFYIEHPDLPTLQCGRYYSGTGTLLLDYYIWTEFLGDYEDPPDLFLQLRVTRMRCVRIPERFIHRRNDGKSMPTRISRTEVEEHDIKDITDIDGQAGDEEFYVLEFDSAGMEDKTIPITFIF